MYEQIVKSLSIVKRIINIAFVWMLALLSIPTVAYGQHAIVTAHPLATQVGNTILERGGNAYDAAVAVSAALAVVEPYSSGFGGGGFWLLYDAKTKRSVMVDGRETAPLAATANMYLDKSGKPIAGLSVNTVLAAGIPGMPAALVHLAKRYGSMPLPDLLAPAITLAKQGFPADEPFIRFARMRLAALRASPEAAAIFLDGGHPPPLKQLIKQPTLAQTIERIARQGKAGFYEGNTARELVRFVRSRNGIWSMEDLADYRVVERTPVRFQYKGAHIISAAPPSSGGIVLAQMFNILAQFKLDAMSAAQRAHHIIEAARRAYKDRSLWLGDSDFVEIPSHLTDQSYAIELAKSIQPNKATPSIQPASRPKKLGQDTTHFSIVDTKGNRVAATLSINYPFGCGLIAGSSGVLLNNEMDDFVTAPGVANLYGLTGGKANAIAPKKRMLSSMSPTFVEDGKRIAVLGTPGGSRIITMVAIGILEFLAGGSAKDIVSAARFHHQYLPDEVVFEPQAWTAAVRQQIEAVGHRLKPLENTYGNMQAIVIDRATSVLQAASDPRGIGVGYANSKR